MHSYVCLMFGQVGIVQLALPFLVLMKAFSKIASGPLISVVLKLQLTCLEISIECIH